MSGRIEYLFDRDDIEEALRDRYPLLGERIRRLVSQARTSRAFPRAKKSDRQIFRILTGEHWGHLRELLEAFDACLEVGWEHPMLLSTRARSQFSSELSTLLVAHALMRGGFSVSSYDIGKGDDRVADILAVRNGLKVVLEVYCPRVFEGIDEFDDEVNGALINVDLPWDYDYRIDFDVAEHLDEKGARFFDPWDFSERMAAPSARMTAIDQIVQDLMQKLELPDSPPERLEVLHRIGESVIKVELTKIERNSSGLPEREGVTFSSLSGHAPEGIFERVIRGGVVSKLRAFMSKVTPADAKKLLFVDSSRIQCEREFSHPWYQKQFAQSLQKHIAPRLDESVAVVIGHIPALPQEMQIPFVVSTGTLSEGELKQVFGQRHTFSKLGEHVLCGAAAHG